jgi:ATP-dependent exoDNAse (exonuclease V) beta subunit
MVVTKDKEVYLLDYKTETLIQNIKAIRGLPMAIELMG